jgi:hypothetical protein
MSGGRPAACKNRPIVEDAARAGWRSWKPPPKGAPCAGLDRHPWRQPVLARRDGLGLALNAHRLLDVIRLLEGVGFLRKAAYEPDGAGRLRLRRPRRNWRIACGNCGNPSQACGGGQGFGPRPDWRNACGNCGNSFAGSKRRPTFRPPGFRRELQ